MKTFVTLFVKGLLDESRLFSKFSEKMVGAVRFELTTFCTPSRRAYQATLRPDRFALHSAGGTIGGG